MIEGLLSYKQLVTIVDSGYITNVTPDLINGSSIDVTLGTMLLLEEESIHNNTVSLSGKDSLNMRPHNMCDLHGYDLKPGEFVLAHSVQEFHLPLFLSAEYKLKSSMARIGLEHCAAGWCDPGWNSSVLTLEFFNCSRYHTIRIKPGDRIGQMIFFEHDSVPQEVSYQKRGRYNNKHSVVGVVPKVDCN